MTKLHGSLANSVLEGGLPPGQPLKVRGIFASEYDRHYVQSSSAPSCQTVSCMPIRRQTLGTSSLATATARRLANHYTLERMLGFSLSEQR
jgi:hypothetical protein